MKPSKAKPKLGTKQVIDRIMFGILSVIARFTKWPRVGPYWFVNLSHTHAMWVAHGIITGLAITAGEGSVVINDRDDGYVDGPILVGQVRHREYPSDAEVVATGHVIFICRIR